RLAVKRGDFVEREDKAARFFGAALDIEDLYRNTVAVPRAERVGFAGKRFAGQGFAEHVGISAGIGGERDRLRRPQAGGLVMAVAAVHAAEIVDNDVGAKAADDADHVFENGVAPDFLRFFGGFGKTEVTRAREIEFHAIAAGGGEQFLRADQAELRSLFGAEIILAAFAARHRKQGHVGVQPAGKIGEHWAGFIVGMRGNVKDAGGDARAVDSFDGFGEAWTRARRGRKLGQAVQSGKNDETGNSNPGDEALQQLPPNDRCLPNLAGYDGGLSFPAPKRPFSHHPGADQKGHDADGN